MQNAGPSYQGSATPGVNFSDHTYDNQLGTHCQSSGYQPYLPAPYHPVASTRPHHYGNHQMQQGISYGSVRQSGAYATTQNQYGPNTNQDMYRNRHSVYAGGNNRSVQVKTVWGENNTSNTELMQPYNQLSPHSQMVNNPQQMPVSSMRSPPHGNPTMTPAQSPGTQHYRQLQSPSHSPHSWPQVQIPSPGMLHSSRTTPSPLSSHTRSPGHNQPFSPPPAAHHPPSSTSTLQAHPAVSSSTSVVPENGQSSSTTSNTNNKETGSNPLHSLQKMVMLDQESKPNITHTNCEMLSDNCDQVSSQISSHDLGTEQACSNESKDSSYSFFNFDENHLHSHSQVTTTGNTATFPTVPCESVPSCHLQMSIPLSSSPVAPNSTIQKTDTMSSIEQTSSCDNVTVKTERSIKDNQSELQTDTCISVSQITSVVTDSTNTVIPVVKEIKSGVDYSDCAHTEKVLEKDHLGLVDISQSTYTEQDKQDVICDKSVTNIPPPICDENDKLVLKNLPSAEDLCKKEDECTDIARMNDSPSDCTEVKTDQKAQKASLRRKRAGVNYEESPSPECESKVDSVIIEMKNPKKSKNHPRLLEEKSPKKTASSEVNSKKCDSIKKGITKPLSNEAFRNPVKVVIHRIRKSDTDDTWHVPNPNESSQNQDSNQSETSGIDNGKTKDIPKVSNIGPQIIILSPAMSKKKFGITGTGSSNSVITIKEDKTVIETVGGTAESEVTEPAPEKQLNTPQKSPKKKVQQSPSKKRGRPSGSRNKTKSPPVSKKNKAKKNNKKRKQKGDEEESEILPKAKKGKTFSGPYVHITGSKQNPLSITVVNVAPKEEEKDTKYQKQKRDYIKMGNNLQKKLRVGHSSTLSPHYDAFNKDKTWLCAFCHKGSHYCGLGDLYGPYYINNDQKQENAPNSVQTPSDTSCPESDTPQSSGRGTRAKRRRSELVEEYIKSSSSKKAKQSKKTSPAAAQVPASVESTPNLPSQSQPESTNASNVTQASVKEVWIHEDCAVWCHGVSLMSQEVHGLEEAIRDAEENVCSCCKLSGATLGCWNKGCMEQYHYICAKEKDCEMDVENFSLLCPKHQKKRRTEKRLRSQ